MQRRNARASDETIVERDGVWVLEGDMLVQRDRESPRGVVHYGDPWPCARVRYQFSRDPEFAVDEVTRRTVRAAIAAYQSATRLDISELPDGVSQNVDFIEIRMWSKGWGNAEVGWQGGRQVLHLPHDPSLSLTLHELGHAFGLGHEHQHPERDKYVKLDLDCVEPGHESNFAYRPNFDLSGPYDFDSVMHYRSASFCRDDLSDADGDDKTSECAFIESKQRKRTKCYPLRRIWGACALGNCEDRDDDGFREYVRGAGTLSPGDIALIDRLHEQVIPKALQPEDLAQDLVVADTDGDGSIELYFASPRLGSCGEVWEFQLHSRTQEPRFCRAYPAKWCDAPTPARLHIATVRHASGREEIVVAIPGGERPEAGEGWIEQWRRTESGELQQSQRLDANDWDVDGSSHRFGESIAVSDGSPPRLAIGAPGYEQPGRVYVTELGFDNDEDIAPDRLVYEKGPQWNEVDAKNWPLDWALPGWGWEPSPGFGAAVAWTTMASRQRLVVADACADWQSSTCMARLFISNNAPRVSPIFSAQQAGVRRSSSNVTTAASLARLRGGGAFLWGIPGAMTRTNEMQDPQEQEMGLLLEINGGDNSTWRATERSPRRPDVSAERQYLVRSVPGARHRYHFFGGDLAEMWVLDTESDPENWIELPRAASRASTRGIWYENGRLFVVVMELNQDESIRLTTYRLENGVWLPLNAPQ